MKLINQTVNWVADQTGIRVIGDSLPHPREPSVQTLRIPGYVQLQPHTCGYVAGLMILHYFRPDYPAERFYQLIRPHQRWGVSRSRLVDTLRLCGLHSTWHRDLDFGKITKAIDQNRPIAMVVRTQTAKHWVVVYGYGRKPNRLFVAANGLPLLSRKLYPYSFFRTHYWAEPGSGLVCAGPK